MSMDPLAKLSKEDNDILLALYKARVDNYNAQGGRLWTRFNYFVLMQSGALWLYFNGRPVPALVAGPLLSVIWYFVAAQDHYFFREHRARVADFERRFLIPRLGMAAPPPSVSDRLPDHSVKQSWVSFGTKRFTVTHFAVYAPVGMLTLWLTLVANRFWSFLAW